MKDTTLTAYFKVNRGDPTARQYFIEKSFITLFFTRKTTCVKLEIIEPESSDDYEYPTFKSAAMGLNLLEDERVWETTDRRGHYSNLGLRSVDGFAVDTPPPHRSAIIQFISGLFFSWVINLQVG